MTTQPEMLRVALHGFHSARVRYYTQLDQGHPEEHLIIPAIEVIYWGCVLDEQLEARDVVYKDCQDYGRKIMLGTRFARNRATHQLPMLIEKVSGIAAPLRPPLRGEEMVWLPVDRLPEGWPAPRQEAQYTKYLAGRPVRNTLDDIAAWFAAEQNRSASPLLCVEAD
ncbi:hypothetical protein PUR59_25275 [Streptomyces sp. SP18ES09]|uniref:hypothetical protein n=1 Tax=unclassified Streptomyces TaxID=2593676 RepID=UPI002E791CEB|nr:hypothetical protein [Streptomyces sp. SP18ES09]MEE1818316.1 hypothetical protein [Streptomyces sp. SP18ES09]